jgi:DNA-directed RNA polymerase subunit M/transcription elongation factor TFIIS
MSPEKTSTMKFCRDCSNFLFDTIEREVEGKRTAFRKCRSCPYEEAVSKANPIVYDHSLQQDTATQYSINPYIEYDPTLPTFTTMVCPNGECATRGKESSIKGIKLDASTVMWYYRCTVCKETWKQLARQNDE